MVAAHFNAGVPVVCVDCPETDAVRLGELFYFFELSAALSACACGIEPFDCPPLAHPRGSGKNPRKRVIRPCKRGLYKKF
jgi:hypothetical protein